jgi:hypothetical protein
MSTASHTLGPWHFRLVPRNDDESGPHYMASCAMLLETEAPTTMNDPVICAIRDDWIGYMSQSVTGRANAALIAASPTMLAALRMAADALSPPRNNDEAAALIAVNYAIANATTI